MLYSLFRFIFLVLFKVLFRIKVYGRQNLPKEGGYILASNHVSHLDPILLGISSPRKLNFMARHDLFNKFILGWLLRSWGVFPVKRDTADLSALKEAMRKIKNGQAVALFPEGTRSRDGSIGEGNPGVGFLAAKLDVPVIPAFIRGTEQALAKGSKFIRPAKIYLSFGEQIPLERRMPYSEITKNIMQAIRHLSCQQLS